MFISDTLNNRIRKISASTGIITTVAGTGGTSLVGSAYQGDGGTAISVPINLPTGLAVDASGDFYFFDFSFFVVKKVTYTTGAPSSSATAAPSVAPAPSSPIATTPTVSSSSSAPAVTLHVTMILLSSLLTLHLC